MKLSNYKHFIYQFSVMFFAVLTFASSSYAQNSQIRKFDFGAMDARENYIISNALHVTLHEFGHMIIDQFRLPVLGQEEDAADNYATFILIDQDTDFADDALANTADMWFILADSNTLDQQNFYGEHDLDIQRGYRIVCHLVGVDPEAYGHLAQNVDLAEDSYDSCVTNFELTAESWISVLEPHLPQQVRQNDIKINYGEAESDLTAYKKLLEDRKFLEHMAEFLDDSLVLPNTLHLEAQSCGQANAFYVYDQVTVVMCYEMLQLFDQAFTAGE